MTSTEKSILATISYYDIFEYPLTSFEIWRCLVFPREGRQMEISAGDIVEALFESTKLHDQISQKDGFHFLRGREAIADLRLNRKKMADQKWKKARKIFRILSVVPFLRAIFVSGSLAMENSKDDSDIDVIVVAKHSRIWTVRTLMTLLTFVMKVRRYGDKTKDRICLNHYITDTSLQIPFESIYNAESYVHLVNVYRDDEEIFKNFQKENSWIKNFVGNFSVSDLGSVRSGKRNKFLTYVSRIFELFLSNGVGNFLENIFARFESSRIKKDSLFSKSGGRITIDENQLEFHPDSHEYFIIPEFNSRMEKLGLFEFANQKDSGLN
jgi:predicted nucleotidyltransferase